MYCGKNKTACQSRRQTAEALMALMQEVPYVDISVTRLCSKAGISRQTFYNLFQSKDNVLIYILEEDCGYSHSERRPGRNGMMHDLADGFSYYIVNHANVLRMLVENDMTHMVRGMLYENFSNQDFAEDDFEPDARDYASSFIAGALTGIAESYVRGGCLTDQENLAQIIYMMLSGTNDR